MAKALELYKVAHALCLLLVVTDGDNVAPISHIRDWFCTTRHMQWHNLRWALRLIARKGITNVGAVATIAGARGAVLRRRRTVKVARLSGLGAIVPDGTARAVSISRLGLAGIVGGGGGEVVQGENCHGQHADPGHRDHEDRTRAHGHGPGFCREPKFRYACVVVVSSPDYIPVFFPDSLGTRLALMGGDFRFRIPSATCMALGSATYVVHAAMSAYRVEAGLIRFASP